MKTSWNFFRTTLTAAAFAAITTVGYAQCGGVDGCAVGPQQNVYESCLPQTAPTCSCQDGCRSCLPGLAGAGGIGGSGIEIGGWLQAGYHNRDGLQRFNTHPDRLNLHQGWLYAEKVADGSDGLGFGFRVDGMYGVDGADTQSFGNTPGNWDFQNGFDHGQFAFAIPQAYVEVASNDFSVKIGHFFTLVGYEVVTAPDNFFYSHAFTMYNSEPFTHTGAIATYSGLENVELYAGWTAGWDTGFDQFGDGSSFLGGASLSLSDYSTLTYIATGGDFGARGTGYSHSLVWDNQLTDKLNWVVQHDLFHGDGTFDLLGLAAGLDDRQIGLNQYLIYQATENVGIGGRLEWWKVDSTSVFDATVGLNLRMTDRIMVRPEYRKDWSPALGYDEDFAAVDVIWTF